MPDGIEKAIDTAASNVTTALDHLFHPVGPTDVFSSPIEQGATIVVTASALERAGGFGFGGGADSDTAQPDSGGGGGGGGGGGAMNVRPVAVITVTEDGVTVVPVIDMTRIAIAALGVLLALRKAMRR